MCDVRNYSRPGASREPIRLEEDLSSLLHRSIVSSMCFLNFIIFAGVLFKRASFDVSAKGKDAALRIKMRLIIEEAIIHALNLSFSLLGSGQVLPHLHDGPGPNALSVQGQEEVRPMRWLALY